MGDLQKRERDRREVDALLMVAMDLLEKTSAMLVLEWREEAADYSLAYVHHALTTVIEKITAARGDAWILRNKYRNEEISAARPQ